MVELTLRFTDATGLADVAAVDETFHLLTEMPYVKQEGGDDDDEAVGGYRRNGIVDRRTYDLQQLIYSIKTASGDIIHDQSDYERRARLLRSPRMFIISCKYNGGQHPRLDESGFYWPNGDLPTPIEVRRTASSVAAEPTRDGERFRWTLTLEDCFPLVGAA